LLYLTAGAARKDQYDELLTDLDAVVGRGSVEKANSYRGALRAKMELLQLDPLDTIQLTSVEQTAPPAFEALASQEVFAPAVGASILGKFAKDGKPAFVSATVGKGRGYYIGALPGQAYVRKGLMPPRPMGKGGPEWNSSQIEPVDFDAQAAAAILRPVNDAQLAPDCATNRRSVVANILQSKDATLIPVVNLAKSVDGKAKDVEIALRGVRPVKKISTALKAAATFENANGFVKVKLPELDEADVIVIEH